VGETLKSLRDAVVNSIQDPSFSDADIDAILNRGLLEIAGGSTRGFDVPTLPPLPDLQYDFEITTVIGDGSVTIPETYQRGNLYAYDESGEFLQRYDSLIAFHKAFKSTSDNSVLAYHVRGKKIFYWGVPSSATIFHLGAYRLPTVMGADNDVPDGIPDHLQYRLLYNYCCMECYSTIEQDVRSAARNTEKHSAEYAKALTDLYSVIKKEEEPQYVEEY